MAREIPLKQDVSIGNAGKRTECRITGHDHTPHWKRQSECRDGWFTAHFNNEVGGGISIDISEFCPGKEGRVSQKRVMVELNARAVDALFKVIAAKVEG